MNRTPKKAKILSASQIPTVAPGMKDYGAERETFPYWKVQVYVPTSCAWKDIQEKHTDRAEADAAGLKAKAQKGRARLMEVQRNGRTPLPEF